ncbi:unnamed protein product, partial [Rotaria sp. Silwood1]
MNPYVQCLENLNSRLDTMTNRPQLSTGKTVVNSKNSSNDNLDNLRILFDYNIIINDALSSNITLSREIGDELSPMIDHIIRLFDVQKEFIRQGIPYKKPRNDQQITELIKGV